MIINGIQLIGLIEELEPPDLTEQDAWPQRIIQPQQVTAQELENPSLLGEPSSTTTEQQLMWQELLNNWRLNSPTTRDIDELNRISSLFLIS